MDQIHVWYASQDLDEIAETAMISMLTDSEKERANQYRVRNGRLRFVARRGLLRLCLAQYAGLDPQRVRLQTDDNGKPFSPDLSDISFNVTHSASICAFAICRSPIGIDIELIRSMPDAEGIVNRFFASRERELYRALSETGRHLGFWAGWTRKEAFLKCIGEGLFHGLDSFAVSVRFDEPGRLLESGVVGQDASEWSLFDIREVTGYVGAVVAHGAYKHCLVKRWPT